LAGSILRPDRRLVSANPNGHGLFSLVRVKDPLNVVAFHSWRVVDISKGIGEAKKRRPIDGSKRPRLRGRRRQQAQAQSGSGGANLQRGHLRVHDRGSQRLIIACAAAGSKAQPPPFTAIHKVDSGCGKRVTVPSAKLFSIRTRENVAVSYLLSSEPQGHGFRLQGIRPRA
jgi:hypothetical protein